MTKIAHTFILLFAIALCSFSNIPQQGSLILMGGGGFPSEVLPYIKSKTGGPIVVITCDWINTKLWKERLGEFTSIILKEGIPTDSPQNLEKVKGARAVILDGGDQYQYVQLLHGTKLAHLISQKYNRDGLILGGTSAGAMIMGEYVFSAKYGTIYSTEGCVDIGYDFFNIPQLKNTLVDTHYTERGREVRLRRFIGGIPNGIGIGVDEGTALIIEGEKRRVVGRGLVHVAKPVMEMLVGG